MRGGSGMVTGDTQLPAPHSSSPPPSGSKASSLSSSPSEKPTSDRSYSSAGILVIFVFDRGPVCPTPLASKCLASDSKNPHSFRSLQAIQQIGAVIRSGEYRAWETASGPPGAKASAQLHPHNPLKKRASPAAAGSGERFRGGKRRCGRDRDSTFFAPGASPFSRFSHRIRQPFKQPRLKLSNLRMIANVPG